MNVKIDYKPKYKKFMEVLLSDVIGPLAIDEQVPTERALIYEYGLSYSTVSRTLKELEREGHIYRVQGKGTFKGSGTSAIIDGESRIDVLKKITKDSVDIGVVFFDIANATDYMMQVVTGVEEACKKKDYDLHVYTTREKTIFKEKDSLLKSLILSGQIDGLVLISPFDERDVFSLLRRNVPFVVMDVGYRNLKGLTRITTDFPEAMRLAMEYFAKHGFNHCGLITGPLSRKDSSVRKGTRDLLEAATQYAPQYGISLSEKLVNSGPYDSGQAMMDELLNSLPAKAVVITDGDIIYQGAVKSVEAHGLDPNRDVFLFNLADTDNMMGRAGIRKPLFEMGENALDLIHEMIEHDGENLGKEVYLKPSLIERIEEPED